MKMPFGKFRGWQVQDLPESYLEWLLESVDLREPLLSVVREALDLEEEDDTPATRSSVPAEVRQAAKEIVSTGYRLLALKRHPDRGGGHTEMVLLNRAKELLEKYAA
jgi:hypothetical protein